MRILVVNINTSESMTESIAETARSITAPGTEIVALTPRFGAESVEGNYESYLAAIAVMETVRAYTEPYDAIIQAGYGEHGREGLPELFEVPVVDITEAAALPSPSPRAGAQGSAHLEDPDVRSPRAQGVHQLAAPLSEAAPDPTSHPPTRHQPTEHPPTGHPPTGHPPTEQEMP